MVWISVGWIAYEMYFKVTDQYNEKWQFDWITNDFWHILNFVFLCIICFLWAPSAAATRYAYSELEGGTHQLSVPDDPDPLSRVLLCWDCGCVLVPLAARLCKPEGLLLTMNCTMTSIAKSIANSSFVTDHCC